MILLFLILGILSNYIKLPFPRLFAWKFFNAEIKKFVNENAFYYLIKIGDELINQLLLNTKLNLILRTPTNYATKRSSQKWKAPKGPKPTHRKNKNKLELGRAIKYARQKENAIEYLPDGEMRSLPISMRPTGLN